MEEKRCDLHIHSIFSDSDTDIEGIFKAAKAKGLTCLAITDHDTVRGIETAKIYSKIYNIELVEAIELSAQEQAVEFHILGYFIDSEDKKLTEDLIEVEKLRRERFLIMVEKLNSLGIKIEKEEILSKVKGAIPTRLHLGMYLVEKKIVGFLWEAFKKYLSPGKPAYAAHFKYSVKEAIHLIKDCQGLAFLAHPQPFCTQPRIEEFISYGLDGLEVVYPRFSRAKISLYEGVADKAGLLKSGGSDAHGSYKEFTEIGGVTIPYLWVEEMKRYRERHIDKLKGKSQNAKVQVKNQKL
ncbi:MAG: PHP domain-containing protein [Candidatus Omnitrophica bacterium]|nr:PHP domain-containing protein [Candidatus Omnitrophota bacterium]MBU1809679.1 PHP domain-containing protein [Candidatus Omnitrophota bacterium]